MNSDSEEFVICFEGHFTVHWEQQRHMTVRSWTYFLEQQWISWFKLINGVHHSAYKLIKHWTLIDGIHWSKEPLNKCWCLFWWDDDLIYNTRLVLQYLDLSMFVELLLLNSYEEILSNSDECLLKEFSVQSNLIHVASFSMAYLSKWNDCWNIHCGKNIQREYSWHLFYSPLIVDIQTSTWSFFTFHPSSDVVK